MTEITYTNCAEAKIIDDQKYIVRQTDLRFSGCYVFAGISLKVDNKSFELTTYTPEKLNELTK